MVGYFLSSGQKHINNGEDPIDELMLQKEKFESTLKEIETRKASLEQNLAEDEADLASIQGAEYLPYEQEKRQDVINLLNDHISGYKLFIKMHEASIIECSEKLAEVTEKIKVIESPIRLRI